MLRHALAVAAALLFLSVGRLAATAIDPYAPDNFPDPTPSDGLAFLVPLDICFANGGNTDCLDNAELTATGPVTDQYDFNGSEEQDSFLAQLAADVYQNGVYQDSVTLNGEVVTVDDRTNESDWLVPYDGEMTDLSLSGVDEALGDLDMTIVPDTTSTGSATISPSGNGFQIQSFFDVFTEITVNGGNPIPTSPAATEFDLASVPEPGSAGLALMGGIVLSALWRRRTAGAA
jgi:hypothetical protein